MLCPYCEAAISTVQLNNLSVHAGRTEWVGVGYSCPICMKILSVGIDPIAIKTDIVDEILAALRKQ